MATFALVHSPLVGPSTWQPVAHELEQRGHRGIVPSLLEATRCGPPFVEPQAAAVAEAVRTAIGGAGEVVLVGHSGAGPLLPVAGRELRPHVSAYLFVDAGLPMANRARADDLHPAFRGRLNSMVVDGLLPPWDTWWERSMTDLIPDDDVRAQFGAELQPMPVALFEERFPEVEGWPDRPVAYLRLSSAYAREEASAAGHGWLVSHVDGAHLDPVVRPVTVVDAMLALVGRLGV